MKNTIQSTYIPPCTEIGGIPRLSQGKYIANREMMMMMMVVTQWQMVVRHRERRENKSISTQINNQELIPLTKMSAEV